MGIFSPKSAPLPAPPPPPPEPEPIPTEVSEEVVDARKRDRTRARASGGRKNTILTSPQGLPSLTDKTKKTLLGE